MIGATLHELEFTRQDGLDWRYREEEESARRWLELQVGSALDIQVLESPARSLRPAELEAIDRARCSYGMWGDAVPAVQWDALDGLTGGGYDTRHYLAKVLDRADGSCKVVTTRTVRLVPEAMTARQRAHPHRLLSSDVAWWETPEGEPLWTHLRQYARRLAPGDRHAPLRVASLGRVATYPHGEGERPPRKRERTAFAFAAIQLLATTDPTHLAFTIVLCAELRDRVLGIRTPKGAYLVPAFPPAAEVLGLSAVRLNRQLPEVQEHLWRYPGYWLDNDDAAGRVQEALEMGLVRPEELADAFDAIHRQATPEEYEALRRMRIGIVDPVMTPEEAREVTAGERVARPPRFDCMKYHRDLGHVLTRPRYARHLVPLLETHPALRALVLQAGDGPFCSILTPSTMAQDARALLIAGSRKYA